LPEIEENRYKRLIEQIFFGKSFGGYDGTQTEIPFKREDLLQAAKELGIELPLNVGDVIYAVRYRTPMPKSILRASWQSSRKAWNGLSTGPVELFTFFGSLPSIGSCHVRI
jgi:hypothetical protein